MQHRGAIASVLLVTKKTKVFLLLICTNTIAIYPQKQNLECPADMGILENPTNINE